MARPKPTDARVRAWEEMVRRRTFRPLEIVEATGTTRSNVSVLLRALLADGLVTFEVVSQGPPHGGPARQYSLTPEAGSDYPWNGAAPAPAWQRQAWQAMRIRRRFTAKQVTVTLAEARSLHTVSRWMRALERAGYLSVDRPGCPSRGEFAVYRITRDVGPQPPRVTVTSNQ